jgi:hypothetical protein
LTTSHNSSLTRRGETGRTVLRFAAHGCSQSVLNNRRTSAFPIFHPLFLCIPHATPQSRPLDCYAPGKFLFGSSILVAASPSQEEVGPYEVKLAPGIWFVEIPGCRGRRGCAVVACAHSTGEALCAFFEHPQQGFSPVRIAMTADLIKQLSLDKEKPDIRHGAGLRFTDNSSKPGEPKCVSKCWVGAAL